MNSIKDCALGYLSEGFSVIPVKYKEKIPMTKWKPYMKKRPDKDIVERWFSSNSNKNIGIITGNISNLVIVDMDIYKNEKISHVMPDIGLDFNTLVVKTGYGYHFYYQYPVGINYTIYSRNNILHGLDIRANGGYVVAPPSVHMNGKIYKSNKPMMRKNISPIPKKLLNFITEVYCGNKTEIFSYV